MELTFVPQEGNKKIVHKCNLASGFFGMVQDRETFNVKPVIGYAIVSEEETESQITPEEFQNLLKEFFIKQ